MVRHGPPSRPSDKKDVFSAFLLYLLFIIKMMKERDNNKYNHNAHTLNHMTRIKWYEYSPPTSNKIFIEIHSNGLRLIHLKNQFHSNTQDITFTSPLRLNLPKTPQKKKKQQIHFSYFGRISIRTVLYRFVEREFQQLSQAIN